MNRDMAPKFRASRNMAMKVPAHEYSQTVAFCRDIIGLPMIAEEAPSVVFQFGDKRLWLDKVDQLSQAEIWLEICADDLRAAEKYLDKRGIVRRDEIEPLPEDFEGFWIAYPANIIHLVFHG